MTVTLACALALMTSGGAQAAGQVTLGSLFKNALAPPAAEPAAAPVAQDPEQAAFQQALAAYTETIKDLTAKKKLAIHEWNLTYLRDRDTTAYTETSIAGMYALRHVRPSEEKAALAWAKESGLVLEYQPIVMFTANGSGFLVRADNFAPGNRSWILYDKAKGYLAGEDARPYIQAMLASMDTSPLPGVGQGKPTFILYTSPSCPYSAKVEPLLEKSGMSFRIFPTYTVNPGEDYAETHRIFCSPNKVMAFREALAQRSRQQAEFKRTGKRNRPANDDDWYCRRDIMPNVLLGDIDFIFGLGYGTPAFYFADGTVIGGADKLDQVRAKSKEMEARGLYFK